MSKKKKMRETKGKGSKYFSGYNPPKSDQRPKPSAKPPAKPSQSQKNK